MTKLVLTALATAVAAAVAGPASAQVSLEANAARSEGHWGGELGAGFTVISIDGFRITPGAGLFLFDGREEGYALEADARCVDEVTGERAPSALCDDLASKLYGRVEATYTIPVAGITAGFGGRFMSGDLRPYGTLSVPLAPRLSLKGNVGPKYYAAGLNARF